MVFSSEISDSETFLIDVSEGMVVEVCFLKETLTSCHGGGKRNDVSSE